MFKKPRGTKKVRGKKAKRIGELERMLPKGWKRKTSGDLRLMLHIEHLAAVRGEDVAEREFAKAFRKKFPAAAEAVKFRREQLGVWQRHKKRMQDRNIDLDVCGAVGLAELKEFEKREKKYLGANKTRIKKEIDAAILWIYKMNQYVWGEITELDAERDPFVKKARHKIKNFLNGQIGSLNAIKPLLE